MSRDLRERVGLTTAEAGKLLGYSARRIRDFIRAGVLPARRFTEGGDYRIERRALDELFARLERGQAAKANGRKRR
jgi:excisionase family DNA binding protein